MTRRSGPDAQLRVGLPREAPSSVTADAISRNPVAPSTRFAGVFHGFDGFARDTEVARRFMAAKVNAHRKAFQNARA
jgi:hypothetical protein